MKISKGQLIAISCSVVVFVALFFANTKAPLKSATETNAVLSASATDFVKDARQSLDAKQAETINGLEQQANTASAEAKYALYDSLVKVCFDFKKPELAAYYSEQAAISKNDSKSWYIAGDRYYMSARFVKEELRPGFYTKAIECLNKSLSIEPNNLKAQTALGVCYVEGTAEPMKGIGLLKDVVAKDSTNIEAQISLALFSEKSNQTDKAIERFNKVLAIDPTYLEAYLHIADAYERTGDKKNAIKNLEKYVALVDDVTFKTEVQNYINKLKNS